MAGEDTKECDALVSKLRELVANGEVPTLLTLESEAPLEMAPASAALRAWSAAVAMLRAAASAAAARERGVRSDIACCCWRCILNCRYSCW